MTFEVQGERGAAWSVAVVIVCAVMLFAVALWMLATDPAEPLDSTPVTEAASRAASPAETETLSRATRIEGSRSDTESPAQIRGDDPIEHVQPDSRSVLKTHGQITVRVLDANGEGLPRAAVIWRSGEDFVEKTTDERGSAMAEELSFGTWEIRVAHPDYAPATLTSRLNPGRSDRTYRVRLEAGASLRGRVVRESGEAIPGARVDWLSDRDADRTERTDQDGTFHLTGLPSAPGRLRVTCAGFRPHLEPRAPSAEDLLEIRLAESRLEMKGRVLESRSDLPVEGARILASLGRASRDERSLATELTLPEVVSDASGHFSLPGLRPGWIHLTALHPDFGIGAESARIEEDSQEELVIRLEAGLPLRAVVTAVADRRPVRNLEVMGTTPDGVRFSARTDEAGELSLMAPVRRGQLVVWSTPSDRWVLLPPNELPASEERITLQADHATAFPGTVVDADSRRPIAGVRIEVRCGDAPAPPADVSDDSGRFLISGVPSMSDYELVATHPDYLPSHWRSGMVASGILEATITMRRGLRIQGRVETPSKEPVAGAAVHMETKGDEVATLTTDAEGRFRSGPLDAASYSVHATWQELESELVELELSPETEDIRLTIGVSPSIRGRVLDDAGTALAGIRLQLRREDRLVAEARSDERGLFRFAHLEEGALYSIDLEGNRRFETPEIPPLQPSDRETTLRLTHRKTGRVEGFLEASSGALPQTVHIEARREDRLDEPPSGEVVRPATGSGRFALDDLPAGDYRFVFQADGFLTAEARGRVEAGRDLALGRITLTPE